MNNPVNQPLLQVSVQPHIRTATTVPTIMAMLLLGLLPAVMAAIAAHGIPAVRTIAASIAASLLGEWCVTMMRRQATTLGDFSAIVGGLLLALALPVSVPWWMAAAGSLFGVVIVKQLFGGLGHSFISPALGGYAFVLISYPSVVAVADGALPLAVPNLYTGLLFGSMNDVIGQTSLAALVAGALFLWYRRILSIIVPAVIIATVFGLYWLWGQPLALFSMAALNLPLSHLASGGLVYMVLFMATDMVCLPLTVRGKFLFGIGCGLLIFLFRGNNASAQAVCYAILLMQCVTPLIDAIVRPHWLGQNRRHHA